MKISRVGILYHPHIEAARAKAEEISRIVQENGGSAWLGSAWEAQRARAALDGTDLIITVGGDGTILRAVSVVVPQSIPITGVNMGRLGFMTELAVGEIGEKVPEILAGRGWLDERAMVMAEVPSPDGGGQPFHALNDVVVARGAICRVISIEVRIGDELFTTYRADGVVLATATGSTGYSLAAGGPVLHPRSGEFTLVPLVPHLGLPYPLVLPAASVVSLRVSSAYDATLSIDGHINMPLKGGTTVRVKQSPYRLRFLRIHAAGFYGALEPKLKGVR